MRGGVARARRGAGGEEDEPPACRICMEGGDAAAGPLVSPCPCRGSIQHLHASCLWRWLRTRHPALGSTDVRPKGKGADGGEQGGGESGLAAGDEEADHCDDQRGGETYRCELCQAPYRLVVEPIPWGGLLRACASRVRSRAGLVGALRAPGPWPYARAALRAAYFVFLVVKLRDLARRSGLGRLFVRVALLRGRGPLPPHTEPGSGVLLLLVLAMLTHQASTLAADAEAAAEALRRYRATWCRYRVLPYRPAQ